MPRCGFCHRSFQSKQSVRAHLGHCEPYRNAKPQGKLPIGRPTYIGRPLPKADKEAGFDPALHARQEVEAEEAKLRLRQVQAAHSELDAKEAQRARHAKEEAEAARRREQEQTLARRRAQLEAEERERRVEIEQQLQRRRREIFQKVKDRVIRQWWRIRYSIPSEVRARALMEIEQNLSALPVEELPETELIEIAEGVRDRLYGPLMAAQDEAEEREQDHQRQESARRLEDSLAKLRKVGEDIRLDRQKDELIRHGDRFASEELDERGIRPGFERYAILEKVKETLLEKLTGKERKAEIEDMVEVILAKELDAD